MTEIFSTILQALIKAEISSPRLETRLLLAEVLQKDPAQINERLVLDISQQRQAEELLQRRLQHEPLDKILGHKEFFKSEFIVNNDVLSPRSDTEILVESALNFIPHDKNVKILDLGTGSGCIIISLLLERLNAYGEAVDISVEALNVAQQNAQRYNLENRLNFVQANWFDDDFIHKISAPYQYIVTNPPYIKTADISNLDVEVKKYDPLKALDGGVDGYDSYRQIAQLAPLLLQNNGYIFIEAGIGQADKISEIFCRYGLTLSQVVTDLSGIKRCIIMQKIVAE